MTRVLLAVAMCVWDVPARGIGADPLVRPDESKPRPVKKAAKKDAKPSARKKQGKL